MGNRVSSQSKMSSVCDLSLGHVTTDSSRASVVWAAELAWAQELREEAQG